MRDFFILQLCIFLQLHLFSPKKGSRFSQSVYPVSYQIIAAYFAEHRGFHFHFVKLHKLFFFLPLEEAANSLPHKTCQLLSATQKLEQNSEPKTLGKTPY